MKIRLWFVDETHDAYLYSKTPPDREQAPLWIPKSVVDHRSKMGADHIVTVQDWWAEKNAERL